MAKALLLDTHAAIWWAEARPLDKASVKAIDAAAKTGGVFVSAVTAWEIAQLSARRRITLSMPPLRWFETLASQPGFGQLELSVEIMIAAFELPGTPPDDPADRFLVATARGLDLCLVTRDARLLDYAQAGHVLAQEC